MATLPRHHRAFVSKEKIRDYVLCPEHPHGKHKARVFEAALGITREKADWLAEQIFEQLGNYDAVLATTDAYGVRYTVDLKIRHLDQEAWVRTAWIFVIDTDYPSLTTCFILKDKKL